jgi:flagellar biosynthesis/type III secretory pathway protein FliH
MVEMTMSSNGQGVESLFASAFAYRDVAPPVEEEVVEVVAPVPQEPKPMPGVSQDEVNRLVSQARAQAIAETQQRMQAEMDSKVAAEEAKAVRIVEQFAEEKKNYFSLVESEVVRLALSIAGRILHREAQVDPMLVTSLVHVALEKLQSGSSVSIHVPPSAGPKWREYTSDLKKNLEITVIEDPEMNTEDCVIETNLGSADFSIEAQLKEVEKGFFDLLAVRPCA